MSIARTPNAPLTARQTNQPEHKPTRRGRSRVRRNTYDLDSEQAQIRAPLGDGETYESSEATRRALLRTAKEARRLTAENTRYGQGVITRVAYDALKVLLEPKQGFDHWSGTNDSAGSQIAKAGIFCKRQWQRLKPKLQELGFLSFVHRSVKTGLADLAGVDRDLQISDLYSFSPDKLKPWIREIFDVQLGQVEAEMAREAARHGVCREPKPLVKRDRPHRRIPALLNPIGWARALAAEAKAKACSASSSYAAREAEAVAFAKKLALNAPLG